MEIVGTVVSLLGYGLSLVFLAVGLSFFYEWTTLRRIYPATPYTTSFPHVLAEFKIFVICTIFSLLVFFLTRAVP